MDKSWTQLYTRGRPQYINGVKEFLKFAVAHMKPGTSKILCPCKRCSNTEWRPPDQVEDHLYAYGMNMDYTRWTSHGEESEDDNDNDGDAEDEDIFEDEEDVDDVIEMLNDYQEAGIFQNFGDSQEYGSSEEESKFKRLMSDVGQELYPGCQKFSKLSFLVKLLHLKLMKSCSNSFFTLLLVLLKEALPEGNTLPSSHYQCKKIIRDLGLGYEKIHACPNHCVLFWKEYEKEEECPNCHAPRYVLGKGKKKKVPHKILRYFPLIPRLQRLFISQQTAVDMKWHKDKRGDDGELRHPADSQVWKKFDEIHESFSMDPRNVRLGLSSDGFNPYGNMSTSYSMWPVFLVPYNLPPWKCMKDPFFFMCLLIPGPKSPGNDIDVFLQPLVHELKELWDVGVITYDAASKQNFRLHAALLWTINDFPAYANLSGWCTKGKLACPTCNKETSNMWLNHGKKTVYMGHRRWLPEDHIWREESSLFDGTIEDRLKPDLLTGDEIFEQLSHVTQPCFGKEPAGQKKRKRAPNYLNWTKKSIFFELPYWRTLLLRHNLDVMHIEKNVCDSLLGTLMNIPGKTKDTYNSRLDLEVMGIRRKLQPVCKNGKTKFKPGCYSFSPKEKKGTCEFMSLAKLPDGMASNISRCVNTSDCRISGMKSHDCHIILQRLLPVALRGYLPEDVRVAIIEYCLFFKELTSKTLKLDILERLNKDIPLILCKLEMYFPPSFFDIMVHLPIHLAQEAMLAGPVQYRWMFPFERKMHNLKDYVRNKAQPEGSIAEGYSDTECITFCSMYFRGIETRFNKPDRNFEGSDKKEKTSVSVFSQHIKLLGAAVDFELDPVEWAKLRWYVLNNCDEVYPYIMEHKAELERNNVRNVTKEQEENFYKWFLQRVQEMEEQGSLEVTEDLMNLAMGPLKSAARYTGCLRNEIRFHTRDREENRSTQNSGVVVEGEHEGQMIDFYGLLGEIIELSYLGKNQVILFKCDWFDLSNRSGIQIDEHNFISVNFLRTWYKNDPFVLACQTKQVFYLNDTKLGTNWYVVQRSQPRGNYDVLEDDLESENEEPYQQESNGGFIHVEIGDNNVLFHRDDMEMIDVDAEIVEAHRTTEDFIMDSDSDAENSSFCDEDIEEDFMSSSDDTDSNM